jgi:hypothetical protein
VRKNPREVEGWVAVERQVDDDGGPYVWTDDRYVTENVSEEMCKMGATKGILTLGGDV